MNEETSTDPVSAEAVRRSLDGCLRAPAFRRSQKLAAFLSYIVDEELAGRGEAIKAYTIATQALGRADSFDPSNDPSVRVEAGRLRRVLDEVYADEGRYWPVRIQVPVGAYRPSFELQEFSLRDFSAEEFKPGDPRLGDPRSAESEAGDFGSSGAGSRPAATPTGPGSGPPGTTAGRPVRSVVAQALALFDTRGQAVLALLLAVIAFLLAVEVALQIYVLTQA